MLRMLIMNFLKKKAKPAKRSYVETILYPKEVYPLYLLVQKNFNYCMKNKLLKREDILEFKEILDSYINTKRYKREKFKNDAHEIYRKLKSTDITKSQMLKLDDYLNQFIQ